MDPRSLSDYDYPHQPPMAAASSVPTFGVDEVFQPTEAYQVIWTGQGRGPMQIILIGREALQINLSTFMGSLQQVGDEVTFKLIER